MFDISLWYFRNSNILEMRELDLHGLTHNEAVSKAEDFVLKESAEAKGGAFSCKIITGNSPKLQIRIIREVIDKHNFDYHSTPYNNGQLIVTDVLI